MLRCLEGGLRFVANAPGCWALTRSAASGTRGDAGGSSDWAGTLLSRIPEMSQECPR